MTHILTILSLIKTETLGIIMKYPTIDSVDTSKNLKNVRTEKLFEMIANCMHEIYDGEKSIV